jgi:hypothetical protein
MGKTFKLLPCPKGFTDHTLFKTSEEARQAVIRRQKKHDEYLERKGLNPAKTLTCVKGGIKHSLLLALAKDPTSYLAELNLVIFDPEKKDSDQDQDDIYTFEEVDEYGEEEEEDSDYDDSWY